MERLDQLRARGPCDPARLTRREIVLARTVLGVFVEEDAFDEQHVHVGKEIRQRTHVGVRVAEVRRIAYPLTGNDIDDQMAQLAAEVRTPIQVGENFYGPRDLQRALEMHACDFVMPDFMRIGGVTGWMRAAAIAGAAGVPMSTHLYPEVAAHVMRATETAHWLEWQDWADPILAHPFEVRDGRLVIPDVPGVGLQWNEDAVRAYRFPL